MVIQLLVFGISWILGTILAQYFIIPPINKHEEKKERIHNAIIDHELHLQDLHTFAKLPIDREKSPGDSLFYAELGVNGKEQKNIIQSKEDKI